MAHDPNADEPNVALDPGTKVEVRNAFDGSWSRDFVVVAHEARGYRLQRRSDGVELPTVIAPESVRRERRRSMWWV